MVAKLKLIKSSCSLKYNRILSITKSVFHYWRIRREFSHKSIIIRVAPEVTLYLDKDVKIYQFTLWFTPVCQGSNFWISYSLIFSSLSGGVTLESITLWFPPVWWGGGGGVTLESLTLWFPSVCRGSNFWISYPLICSSLSAADISVTDPVGIYQTNTKLWI